MQSEIDNSPKKKIDRKSTLNLDFSRFIPSQSILKCKGKSPEEVHNDDLKRFTTLIPVDIDLEKVTDFQSPDWIEFRNLFLKIVKNNQYNKSA